jgi:hypothetical protein
MQVLVSRALILTRRIVVEMTHAEKGQSQT